MSENGSNNSSSGGIVKHIFSQRWSAHVENIKTKQTGLPGASPRPPWRSACRGGILRTPSWRQATPAMPCEIGTGSDCAQGPPPLLWAANVLHQTRPATWSGSRPRSGTTLCTTSLTGAEKMPRQPWHATWRGQKPHSGTIPCARLLVLKGPQVGVPR